MKNVEEFYNNTNKMNKPAPLLRGFFDMNLDKNLKEKIAIDLGAGTGNDTKFLIEKGFKVTCVDKEEKSREIITEKIADKTNLEFIIGNFENIKLHKADLIYSCFSLHFCKPDKIDDIMSKIITNIIKGGYFVREFFRKRRQLEQ